MPPKEPSGPGGRQTLDELVPENYGVSLDTTENTLLRLLNTVVDRFAIWNKFALIAVAVAFASDLVLILAGKIQPADRLVSSTVLASLLGATAIQVGAMALSMSKSFNEVFRRLSEREQDDQEEITLGDDEQ